eukprot:758244-Rhodomonas_salina.5
MAGIALRRCCAMSGTDSGGAATRLPFAVYGLGAAWPPTVFNHTSVAPPPIRVVLRKCCTVCGTDSMIRCAVT